MSFSLSNARERPPTRAASGKHGCTLARHTRHQPRVQLLPSLLSGAPRVCCGPSRARCARSVAPHEPHDTASCDAFERDTAPRGLVPHKALHHERIARMCIRCCSASFSSVRWTERARACGAHTGTGRFIAHACFCNVHLPVCNTLHYE